MPKHEHEVVIYGETFWPNPKLEVSEYTYDRVRAACWYFNETNRHYTLIPSYKDDVKGRAMMTRLSTRWFGEQRDKIKRVFQLVHAMASAMEENPSGESKRPPSPTTDGEWP